MEEVAEKIAVKNVPALRFPGFEGEWVNKKGSELFINSRTKGDETLPIFSVTLDRGLVSRDSLDRSISNSAKATDNLFVAKDDIAYNMMRMWQGAYGLANTNCMVSPAYVVLHPKTEVCSNFFVNLFSRKRSLFLFTAFSYGLTSDRLRLYFKDFAHIKFATPRLAEQQKIASFLSAVDDKVQQLTKKKGLLEQYKTGVMQQLFSQQLRFKMNRGQEFPEWEEKRLGDIGQTYNGLTGKSKEDFSEGKPYIQYKQIFDDSRIDISRFDYVTIKENDSQNQVLFGDIFFTVSSETPNEIGTSSVLLDEVEELYLNSFCFGYRANSMQVLNPHFARYLFRSEVFRRSIIKLAQGSTRYNMSKVGLMKLSVKLPCQEEQVKISNFLSAIDQKIDLVTAQLHQTKTFKKGLLQQLFV